jgi:hypothetical protein
MDHAQITDGFSRVSLAGRPYNLRLLKLREWSPLQKWLKEAVPSPVAEAIRCLDQLKTAGDKVDADLRKDVLDHAQEAARFWPPPVGSLPWFQALNSIDGGTAQFLRVALKAAGQGLSEEQAIALEAEATIDEVADVIRVCLQGNPPLRATAAPTEPGGSLTKSKRTAGVRRSSSKVVPAGRTAKSVR